MVEYQSFIGKKPSFKELDYIVFKSSFAEEFINYFLNCIKSNLIDQFLY